MKVKSIPPISFIVKALPQTWYVIFYMWRVTISGHTIGLPHPKIPNVVRIVKRRVGFIHK